MEYKVVPIELVDYPLDRFTNKLREMFGDNVDNSDAELVYEAAIAVTPDTNLVMVDKAKFEALLSAGNELIADIQRRYPNEELRCPYMIALNQTLKDMEGNHG